jgi:heme-degrading monooxygenase HmoA
MYIALTTRKLKPGAYDAFRAAWQPDEFPPGLVRATHARSVDDPDEIVSFGLIDGSREDMQAWMGEHADQERRRQEAMAEHVQSTGVDAIFEVVDEVTP